MTNEEVARAFDIKWHGGMRIDPPVVVSHQDEGVPIDPSGRDVGQRDRVLDACPFDAWVSRHEIAAAADVTKNRASGQLWVLQQLGLVRRKKDLGKGVWLFQRIRQA